jgi:hypothetical protein
VEKRKKIIMGAKSRGNFKIPLCMKFDCKNRPTLCKECLRDSNYEKRSSGNNKDN